MEEKLLGLDSDHFQKLRSLYNLDESTVSFIHNVLEKIKDPLSSKVDFKYDIKTYDKALSNTLSMVNQKIKQLKLEDIVSENSKEVDEFRQRVFEASKKEATYHLERFIRVFEDTFYNERKIRHLKRVDYYMSFLLHDEVIQLEGSINIFRNFYKALYYAYKMQIYFLYCKNEYVKVTLP